MEGTVQVTSVFEPGLETITFVGATRFCETTLLAMAVQPLAGFVTVIVYVPDVPAVADDVVDITPEGPLQL
jgi:hypothetical protein